MRGTSTSPVPMSPGRTHCHGSGSPQCPSPAQRSAGSEGSRAFRKVILLRPSFKKKQGGGLVPQLGTRVSRNPCHPQVPDVICGTTGVNVKNPPVGKPLQAQIACPPHTTPGRRRGRNGAVLRKPRPLPPEEKGWRSPAGLAWGDPGVPGGLPGCTETGPEGLGRSGLEKRAWASTVRSGIRDLEKQAPDPARKAHAAGLRPKLGLQHVFEASGNCLRFLCKTGSSLPLSTPICAALAKSHSLPRPAGWRPLSRLTLMFGWLWEA